MGTPCRQALWARLRRSLKEDWGVRPGPIPRGIRVLPGDARVRVSTEADPADVDALILATSPEETARLLPPENPLQPLLSRSSRSPTTASCTRDIWCARASTPPSSRRADSPGWKCSAPVTV